MTYDIIATGSSVKTAPKRGAAGQSSFEVLLR